MGPSLSPIQWVAKALEIEQLRRAAVYTPPSSAEVKNGLCCTSTPHTPTQHTQRPQFPLPSSEKKYSNLNWTVSQR